MIATRALVTKLARRQQPEAQLQAACLKVFVAYGILAYPMNREKGGGRKGAKHVGFTGLPDVSGVLPGGRAFFSEIKRRGQYPTLPQIVAISQLERQGAFVCVVHSVEEAHQAAKEATGR